MAESSSTQTSRQDGNLAFTLNPTIIPPALKFLMGNVKSIIHISLTAENYPLWSTQIQKIFTANGFEGFLNGSAVCPPQFHLNAANELSPNPDYTTWKLIDQNLAAVIYSTISTSILPYIINLSTTYDIRKTLLKRLQSSNRSQGIQVKNELHHISLKTNTMTHYLSEVKALVDNISAAGSTIDTEDIILYILNGLPPSYQAFKTTIRTRTDPISLDDLYSLLISEELNLAAETSKENTLSQQALFATRGCGRSAYSRGRGKFLASSRSSNQQSHNNSCPTRPNINCQICQKQGHYVAQCWHRTNLNNISTTNYSNPAAFHADRSSHTNEWILDSDASSHLASNYSNHNSIKPYSGTETVTVGDVTSLPISHTGVGLLPTPSKLLLSKIFHVPQLSDNLLSIC